MQAFARPPGNGARYKFKIRGGNDACDRPQTARFGGGFAAKPNFGLRAGRHAAAAAFGGGVRHWLFARTSMPAAQAGVPPPVRPRGLTKLPRSIVIRSVGEPCSCRGEPKRSVRGCRGRPLIRIRCRAACLLEGGAALRRTASNERAGNFVRGVSGRAQYRICRGAIRCVCTFFLHLGISGPSVTAPSPGATRTTRAAGAQPLSCAHARDTRARAGPSRANGTRHYPSLALL